MSVRPCVRVSVRPRVRPASLPVSPVRPVLLLKTTCEKKKKKITRPAFRKDVGDLVIDAKGAVDQAAQPDNEEQTQH